MAASGLLQGTAAVFYHPLDAGFVENTQGQTWTGNAGSVAGKIGTADSAITSNSFSYGTTVELDNMSTTVQSASKMDLALLSTTRMVAIYRDEDDTRTGKARVGTISGTTITWGAPTAFSGTNVNRKMAIVAMSDTKVIVAYRGLPQVAVGTVSGTDISFGTALTVRAAGSVGGLTVTDCMAKLDSTRAIFASAQIVGGSFTPYASILTISGTTVTTGPIVQYDGTNDPTPFTDRCVALSSTKAVVFNFSAANAVIRTRVATISGTSITFGPKFTGSVLSANINSNGNYSVTALDSTRFVCACWLTTGLAEGVVGTVSGTDITYGATVNYAANNAMNPRIKTLDSSHVVVVWQQAITDPGGKARIGTVTGTSISWGASTEWTATFGSSSSGFPLGLVAIGSDTIAIAWHDSFGTTNYESVIGQIDFTASLTAPTPAAYPDAIGATRVAVAFWCNSPTKGDATITINRSYSIELTATSISLGGTTAVWDDAGITTLMDDTTGLNDGTDHLLVMDFVNTGGTNWNLQTSVDGVAFIDQGAQDSGTQIVTTVTTDPNVSLSDPLGDSEQWVDELVMWVDNELFSSEELDNMYELANTFGEPMDEYQGKFGAPVCWQATGTVNGRSWGMSGAGPCPAVIRIPRGAHDIVVTDNGKSAAPRIIEG